MVSDQKSIKYESIEEAFFMVIVMDVLGHIEQYIIHCNAFI